MPKIRSFQLKTEGKAHFHAFRSIVESELLKKANANEAFNYLSIAGGAFLEWLEGNKSPGFLALEDNNL